MSYSTQAVEQTLQVDETMHNLNGLLLLEGCENTVKSST